MTPENDLNRILTALREAEPSPGLTNRILNHLEQSPAPISQARWYQWQPLKLSFATAIAAVVFVLTLHHTQTQSSHPQTLSSRPERSALERFSDQTITAIPPKPRMTHLRDSLIAAKVGISQSDRSHQLLCDCDPIALAQTLAPSQPAPPLALTPQERLLLSVARRDSPIELAELDQFREPALRAAAAARERAALRQYAHGLLDPLAISQSLDATPQSAPATEDPQPDSTPETPTPTTTNPPVMEPKP